MKIIDAHTHFSNVDSIREGAISRGINYTEKELMKEYNENNVVASIGMGVQEAKKYEFPDIEVETPMGLDLDGSIPNMFLCAGINPYKLSNENLTNTENMLKYNKAIGIKIYAGYYHVDINDKMYEPIYELAKDYNVPVVIHTGDTVAEKSLLKYSHPLAVDELAVYHRGVNFVIAHIGDPWIMDAMEVVSKNSNVSCDISGLLCGDTEDVKEVMKCNLLMDRYKVGLMYMGNYEKVMFGTDWPLTHIKDYIDFSKAIVPEKHYENVFYNNAKRIFKLQDV